MARPSIYTEELANEICERIADGESLKHITDQENMPFRSTVHRWILTNTEFCDKYKDAKESQADVYADEMDEIAHDTTVDVQRARLIIDTRKWVAAKLRPKKYGDKVDITTDGDKINNQPSEMTDEELAKRIESYLGRQQK